MLPPPALTYTIMPAAIIALVIIFLKVKYHARFFCAQCDISFSWIDSLRRHAELVHGGAQPAAPPQTRILVLGSGFAGMEALKKFQSRFQSDAQVDITLVSRNNFFLFTPMLHEVSSGMIDTRHIAAPVRALCQRARFYESEVESVDLESKRVVITHAVGKEPSGEECRPDQLSTRVLRYDYLVLALGNETRFSGDGVEKNAFALKDLHDAILLRNHVISMLEQADQVPPSPGLERELMTFVVAGGGLSGVEVVGELNDFVRDAIKSLYHNIDPGDVRVVLVSSAGRLLPDLDQDLGEFALRKLQEKGVEVILNTRVQGAIEDRVALESGDVIPCRTLVWTAGVAPERLAAGLACEHDRAGRISVNECLEVKGFPGVYAVGDCASVIDMATGRPCPATAQHALRQGRLAAENIAASMKGRGGRAFSYRTKGVMATVGKKNGIAIIYGVRLHGFMAWWLWRTFYLANLPTVEKKLRVMADWTLDLFFTRDITRVKTFETRRDKINVKAA